MTATNRSRQKSFNELPKIEADHSVKYEYPPFHNRAASNINLRKKIISNLLSKNNNMDIDDSFNYKDVKINPITGHISPIYLKSMNSVYT